MFRAELQQKLQLIFAFKKSTFNAPSVSSTGSFEQEILFIEINESKTRARSNKVTAEVSGSIVTFAQVDKLPYGYFQKRISIAPYEAIKGFFFSDIDLNPVNSPARIQNISERRIRFVYLYSAQFDPEHGEMTSLEIGE